MRRTPSATAGLVARGIAFHSTHPRHAGLVPPAAAELAVRFATAAGLPIRRGRSRWDRAIVAIQERLVVPGLTLQYVLRKRRIESIVRGAIADGYRQIVVLGAGFDSLALRLRSGNAALRLIEVDRPETQGVKQSAIGSAPPIAFVAADVASGGLRHALGRVDGYDPGAKTLFVAEAVFLYLSEKEVERALHDIRHSARTTRLVFTFFGTRGDGKKNFRDATILASLWLKLKNEPVRWAIDPAAVAGLVSQHGFDHVAIVLDEQYHDCLPAARGEHIAIVESA